MKQVLVLGGGLIGARHAQSVQQHAKSALVGVVEPNSDLHIAPDTAYFCDLSEVSAAVDGAIIATPTPMHSAHGIEAARRGWDILIEKPVTATMQQAKALSKAVTQSGVASLVGHHRRYHHSVQYLKKMVEGGEIGAPITATMIWAMRKPDDYFKQNWRTKSGSPVMINLVHDIDLLRFVLGEITDLSAVGAAPIRGTQRIESGAVALLFASGATAAISFADTTPSPWGFEAGTDENPHIANSGQDMLWITGTHGGVAFPSMTKWSGAEDWSQAPQSEHLKIPKATPLRRQLDHFVEVMERKVPPLIPVFDAQKTLHATLKVEALLNKKRGGQIMDSGKHQTKKPVNA